MDGLMDGRGEYADKVVCISREAGCGVHPRHEWEPRDPKGRGALTASEVR